MADRTERTALLTAVEAYVPRGRLTNDQLAAEHPDLDVAQFAAKTGIESRAVGADDQLASDLGVLASAALLEGVGMDRDAIDFLLLTTTTPDYAIPSTASIVHGRLGLDNTAGALDVTVGCAGYTYCLSLAGGLIEAGRARRVLIVTTERITAYTDGSRKGTRAIFGDGATASLVEASDCARGGVPVGRIGASAYGTESSIEGLAIQESGLAGELRRRSGVQQPAFLAMDGPAVFDFTLRVIGAHVERFLGDNELALDAVDLFIFHQANAFMLERLRRRLKIPKERFVVHLGEIGNTVSSTVPIALRHALQSGLLRPGMRVLLVGFGVGFSWCTVELEYQGE